MLFLHSPGTTCPRNGAVHSRQGPPAWINNQDNLSQTFLQTSLIYIIPSLRLEWLQAFSSWQLLLTLTPFKASACCCLLFGQPVHYLCVIKKKSRSNVKWMGPKHPNQTESPMHSRVSTYSMQTLPSAPYSKKKKDWQIKPRCWWATEKICRADC